jgi:hypothetical protein
MWESLSENNSLTGLKAQRLKTMSKFFVNAFISDLCPAGTYLSDDEEFCLSCQGNTFSTEGASSCTPCETRTFTNAEKTRCGTFLF